MQIFGNNYRSDLLIFDDSADAVSCFNIADVLFRLH